MIHLATNEVVLRLIRVKIIYAELFLVYWQESTQVLVRMWKFQYSNAGSKFVKTKWLSKIQNKLIPTTKRVIFGSPWYKKC